MKNEPRRKIEAMLEAAQVEHKRKRYDEAIRILQEACDIVPEPKDDYWQYSQLQLDLASNLMELKRFAEASQHLEAATARSSLDELPAVQLMIARCLYEQGRIYVAVEAYRKASELCGGLANENTTRFFAEDGESIGIELLTSHPLPPGRGGASN